MVFETYSTAQATYFHAKKPYIQYIQNVLTVPVQPLFRVPNKDNSFPQITSVQW